MILKQSIYALRIQLLGPPSPQHLNRRIPVDQFAAFGLTKAFLDMGGDGFALSKHPVFKIELLADDLKSLIENLAGALIRPRPHGKVDHALLFRFQID